MRLEPNVIVLYVDNVAISSQFYQDVLRVTPEEDSPTFHAFRLSNGMTIGLKHILTVQPPVEIKAGVELAFTVDNKTKVDELFADWQSKEIKITLPPIEVPFGYTFVAVDPDDNRLRVVSLGDY